MYDAELIETKKKVDAMLLQKDIKYLQGYKQGELDAIDKMIMKLEMDMPSELDGKERYGYTVALSILLEQLKEQNK